MTDEKVTTTTEETPDKRTTVVETDRWVPEPEPEPKPEVTKVETTETTTVEPKE
jgi:hypothetical protein